MFGGYEGYLSKLRYYRSSLKYTFIDQDSDVLQRDLLARFQAVNPELSWEETTEKFPLEDDYWVTVYDGTATKYYLDGSLNLSSNHSGTMDVGTNTRYIYIGNGYWNSSNSNKASMSHMSDIGIWNAKALSASEISNLYTSKRTIAGY